MYFQPVVEKSKKRWPWLLRTGLLVLAVQPVQVLGETLIIPGIGGEKGTVLTTGWGLLDTIKRYIGQGGVIIGLVLGVVAFIWVGYAALTKFNEAREGRAEWSELAVLAIAGAIILIFVAILINQAGGVATKLES